MKLKTTPIKLESKGYFGLNVYKEDGSEVLEKRIAPTANVVTYGGAFRLFFNGKFPRLFDVMNTQVGTGTSVITRADTGLTSLLATSSAYSGAFRGSNEVTNSDGTATLTSIRTTAFTLGAVVGTISEVGLTDGSVFIAGQLLKDEFGAPTTLTLLSDEQLVVTYTLLLTYPDDSATVQPLIGSGSVTTPTGTSTYSMYPQPFFTEYLDINDKTTRLARGRGDYYTHASSGIAFASLGGSPPNSVHDGAGNVSITFSEVTAPPASFSSTDIRYIGVNGDSIASSQTLIDNTSKRGISAPNGSTMLIAEFDPPLTKTADDSLTVQFSIDYSV